MRVCVWCGTLTPVVADAPWAEVTWSGALLPCEASVDQDDADALCLACLPDVQAILQAHAWGEEGPSHA